MVTFQVAELSNGQRFKESLILDKRFIVLDSNIPFSSALQSRLVEWGFKEVYSDQDKIPEKAAQVKAAPAETVDIDLDELNQQYEEKSTSLNASLKKSFEILSKDIKNVPEKIKMKPVLELYEEFLKYTQILFTRYVTHKELRILEISESMAYLIEFVKENKKYVLRIQPKAEHKLDKNYLTNHCLRTTIYAVVIALQIKMPSEKIIDLAVAGILHEIGQIKLPPQLYLTDKPLSPQSRNLLSTHTVLGYNILKENGFSLPIQVGVLEHHERENGQGYPRKLTGDKISAYGKILSVACSYEAITSPRRYREARSLYEATIEMLMNKDKQYDDVVLRALVSAVSIFPIGTYVYLANGKVAQVSESNPADPRMPLVEVVGETNEAGNPRIIMTDNEKHKISRVLNKEEVQGLLSYIKK